jgi:hypothetical protein
MEHAIEVTRQACDQVPGAWEYLKARNDVPFMFSDENIINTIAQQCDKIDPIHSGASFAVCMRYMAKLAKNK